MILTTLMEKVPMPKRLASVRILLTLLALALLPVALAACGSSSGQSSAASGKPGAGAAAHLTIVAYSTPQGALEELMPAFQATAAGRGVSFSQSYGPSGEQSRAVAAGLHANVVDFSLEPDVTRLVEAGLVSPSWNTGPTKGMVTDSVGVIIVRKGNPKHITGWADLLKPDVEVLTPNPFTSGGARWNILAAYGAQIKEGKSPAQATSFLQALFRKVVSQDNSARKALQTFLAGRGDALIDYENEAIGDIKKGAPIQYVIPNDTIQIENPIAVVGKGGEAAEAQRFVSFLLSPAAQAIWVKHGYRPVISGVPGASAFKQPAGLFTLASLGGWSNVGKQFFAPGTGIVTKIEESLGVSTAK